MFSKTVQTPKGPVTLRGLGIYDLKTIVNFNPATMQNLSQSFNVEPNLMEIIKVLAQNNLIDSTDLELINDSRFYQLLALPNLMQQLKDNRIYLPPTLDRIDAIRTILQISNFLRKVEPTKGTISQPASFRLQPLHPLQPISTITPLPLFRSTAAIKPLPPLKTASYSGVLSPVKSPGPLDGALPPLRPTPSIKPISSIKPQPSAKLLIADWPPAVKTPTGPSQLSRLALPKFSKSASSIQFKWSLSESKKRREFIAQTMIKERFGGQSDPPSMSNSDLQRLFQLYDSYFFGGYINHLLTSTSSTLTIVFSSRMTKNYGYCAKKGCIYNLSLSWATHQRIAAETNPRNQQLGGIPCQTTFTCLQLTFEHELIHLVLFLEKVKEKSHGPIFRQRLFNIFGQTEVAHHTHETEFSREEAQLGMRVSFTYKGQTILGAIYRINPKRAKIHTDDGQIFNISYSSITPLLDKRGQIIVIDLSIRAKPRLGARVSFMFRGRKVYGTINKLNPTKARIVTDNKGTIDVPYPLLTTLS